MGASRVAFAEVALDDFIMNFIDEGAPKGAGGDASHAFDAATFIEVDGSGFFIAAQGIKEARLDTGGIIALQANDRHEFVFGMSERIDAASPLFEIAGMAEGASELTGAASSAERGIDNKAVFHRAASCAAMIILPIVLVVSIRLQSSQSSK